MKWIAISLALLIVAIAFDLGMLVYAFYALAAILLITNVVSTRWSGSIAAAKTLSKTQAKIGETIDITIELDNTDRWPITWMLIEDLLPRQTRTIKPALDIDGDRIAVRKFAAGEKLNLEYQIFIRQRGYFQIGPLVCETGDMFGFNRKIRVLTEPDYLLVLPKVIPLSGYDIASRRPIGEVVMTNRLFEDPTRIAGVRDYQAGDPLNRIHWKKIREYGKAAKQDLRAFVDGRRNDRTGLSCRSVRQETRTDAK